jgi:uncharacterized protein YndB with AHSA1/START domain
MDENGDELMSNVSRRSFLESLALEGAGMAAAKIVLTSKPKDARDSAGITSSVTTFSDRPAQSFTVTKNLKILAPAEAVFETLLEEIGPRYVGPNGASLQLKIEPWPGGRWFRDYGNNTGYFWAHVQSIKPPVLLELYGPMFMSSPVISQVQFRLAPDNGGTEISLIHSAFGEMPASFQDGAYLSERWSAILSSVRGRAEK